MNLNTMAQMRHQTWLCFSRSRDALLDLVDALASSPDAHSLPELSLSPQFQGPVWVSVDSTSIARPEAEKSPDRGIIYVPNMPLAKRPGSRGGNSRR